MEIILLAIAIFTVILALVAIITKDKIVAVIAAGATGLFVSIMFVILGAPDVAMTEAAIGSGLTTFIFFFALKKVRGGQND